MSLTDGFELVDPASYGQNGPPHELWSELRKHDPVHRCEARGAYPPFWAITKHADICDISKRPDTFLNEPGIVMVKSGEVFDRASDYRFEEPVFEDSCGGLYGGWNYAAGEARGVVAVALNALAPQVAP